MAPEEQDEAQEHQTGDDSDVGTGNVAGSDEHNANEGVAADLDRGEEQNKDPAFAIDCGTLPIDLHFEIARQSSNVDELAQLKVGSVIDLGKPPESLVSIYANGRQVATAELVMVDGKVGVRIKTL